VSNNLKEILINTRNPLRIYGFSQLVIGISGIIISTISLKNTVKIMRFLIRDKAYMGNELYLVSILLTLAIGIIILGWGFKNLTSGFINIIRYHSPIPREFENYDEIESVLVKKKIPPTEKLLDVMIKKNKSFIKKFLFFSGFVMVGLLGKMIIPNEFFWNLRLSPKHFSFPLLFFIILATIAVLRWASIYFYHRIDTREMEVFETIKSIKGESNPFSFVPRIKKALQPLQRHGKSNFISQSGFNETEEAVKNIGKINKKLFCETYPQLSSYGRNPIIFLFAIAAVMLFIIGFLFLSQLPPDNISVLSVPIIALDYSWTVIKGFILVVCGLGLLKNVNRILNTFNFESIMIFVEISGVYEKETTTAEKPGNDLLEPPKIQDVVFKSDCHFKIYTTKLLTEMDLSKEKRNINSMFADIEAENTKKIIVNTIETFGQKRTSQGLSKIE